MTTYNSLPHYGADQAAASRAEHAGLIGAANEQIQAVMDDIHQLVADLSQLEATEQTISSLDKLDSQVVRAALAVQFDNPTQLRNTLENILKHIGLANSNRTPEA